MKKIGYSLSLTALILSAHESDITSLLAEYRDASDLSNKTRIEALGHVSTYTREDIERYHYYKLSDLLKGIHFVNYEVGRYGWGSPNAATTRFDPTTYVRLYLDDQDVGTCAVGTAMIQWSELPLEMIDHIELYENSGAFALGNEPGIFIIKMYTKDPHRNEGTMARLSLSDRGDREAGLFYGAVGEKWNSTLYGAGTLNDTQKYELNGVDISHERRRKYLIGTLNSETTSINAGYISLNQDLFSGSAIDFHPSSGYYKTSQFYANITQSLLNDPTFLLTLSYNQISADQSERGSLFFPPMARAGLMLGTSFDQSYKIQQESAFLRKTWKGSDWDLFLGTSYKYVSGDQSLLQANGYTVMFTPTTVDLKTVVPIMDSKQTGSLIAEAGYELSRGIWVKAGAKMDHARYSNLYDTEKTMNFHGGIVMLDDAHWTHKLFASHTELPPVFANILMSDSAKQLKPEQLDVVSWTSEYKAEDWRLQASVALSRDYYFIALNPTTMVAENMDSSPKQRAFGLDGSYSVSSESKIDFGAHTTSISGSDPYSAPNGGYLRGVSMWNDIDFMGEVIYRSGYTTYGGYRVDEGYRINLGATFPINRTQTLKLKGENLFGAAQETLLMGPTFTSLLYDRPRILAQFEWSF
ncbi:TonB-dependent receptor plug domain-containing protein [Sulfuricurvum sp.]|uniref:TonB-dependent receptor plug domain-containing protein n=1 Tax=Sulfuricurvum sp. TaxID=2025608 RepID=UPI002E2F37E0|nr:TonB-dependent receptor plug domain-containing protein [Sulfuricurvum sp.]HEX5329899.1 TonB-dependent receptor plug domain-containing protein [Sulfuricurvum sp.]